MARLTKTEAVKLLAAEAVTTTTDSTGEPLELRPRSATGTQLVALAERLRLASAGQLTARVHDADGRPWVVGLEIESAEFHDQETARVTLRAAVLRLDRDHRQAERTALNGAALLTAVNCQNVVDGDVVQGTIIDVADGGVAVSTRRLLRPGDRLTLRARFFATEFEAEVRVVRVEDKPGAFEVGCRFIEIEPAQRRTLRELTQYRRPSQATAGLLRELAPEPQVETAPAPTPSFWRRVLRRAG